MESEQSYAKILLEPIIAQEMLDHEVRPALWAGLWRALLSKLPEDDTEVIKKAHEYYWNENPPKKIIIASASLRKAIHISMALNGFKLSRNLPFMVLPYDPATAETPMDINNMMEEHIHNGDGTLQEEIFLGKFFGVSVVMHPSDGESPSNEDPSQESWNKINAIKDKYEGQDVIIVASDTVGRTNRSDNNLGKAAKESAELELEPDDPGFANAYRQQYWLRKDGEAPIISYHHNSIVAWRPMSSSSAVKETSLEQEIPLDPDKVAKIQVLGETGAGGVNQQLFKWDQPISKQISDEQMRQALQMYPDDLHGILLLDHIMGAPIWALPELLRQLTLQEAEVAAESEVELEFAPEAEAVFA